MKLKTRGYTWILGGLFALALALRIGISLREWFVTDDFYFLAFIQSPRWDWYEVFLPTKNRLIAAYRPIGLESYFFAGFAAFGWNVVGYYVTGLVLQLLTALCVFRIAKLEEYDTRVALAVAVIAAIGGQSLIASYAVAEHNYLCSALCYAASLMWFLEYLKTDRARYQVLGGLALSCGVLSNDACATMPALAFGVAFLRARTAPVVVTGSVWEARLAALDIPGRLRQAVARTLPHFFIVFLYGDFRIWGVPFRQENWFYEVDYGFDMVKNTFGNVKHAFGGGAPLIGLVSVLAAAVWFSRRSSAGAPGARAPRFIIPVTWLLLGYLPFAVLAFPATRFSLAQLPAAALCAGVIAELILRRVRSPAFQNAALLVVVCLCIPWQRAVTRLTHPKTPELRPAFELAQRTLPTQENNCLIVYYGGDGLANTDEGVRFRLLTFSGAMFRAAVPDKPLDVEFEDARLGLKPYGRLAERECTEFELHPDRTLSVRSLPSDARAELTR